MGVEYKVNDITQHHIDFETAAFESNGININVMHTQKGFIVSVLDRTTNIMSYYDVVDGELKFLSKENVITGMEIWK